MHTPEPFYASTKRYEMTEETLRRLKSRLLEVRKQYLLGMRLPEQDISVSKALESEIDRLEHLVAHAAISDSPTTTLEAFGTESTADRSFLSRVRNHAASHDDPETSAV